MPQFGLPWPGREVAAEAEAAGVTAFATGDFADHDAYVTVAEMALGTSAAQVGTAIAYAFSRTPFAHAAAVRSLWSLAPGRVFAGFGSGAFAINRDWCGVDGSTPVRRMADLVGAVRAWLQAENGAPVRYQGEFYRIDAKVQAPVLGPIGVPVLMAGFNPVMTATAARVADGIIGHGLFTAEWWDDVIRPALARGGRDSERQGPVLEHGWLLTAVDDDDPERAVRDIRRMIAFYLTVRTYDAFAEHHGWMPQVRTLRAAFAEGRIDDMAAAVTDDMLEAIAVCGSTADAAAALERRRGSIAQDVVYLAPPSFMVSHRRRAAYARASLPLLKTFHQP
jgi:alkanesulfonate monooxygenase SsuD/methylene tetrahydromethanopterin reductase-like flavin-dependent oxidoreductase (luciferase family)